MSKTVSCVLLKVLILARAGIMSMYSNSDSIQDILVPENNDSSFTSHLDNVKGRNKIDEILFTNISVIPESIESILSKPISPRAFVEFHNGFPNKEDDISVTFRWNQPEFTDEVIQGYTVQCWFIESQRQIQICDDKSISATILERTLHNLKPSTTYYFQVRAHTKVGAGPYTDLIDVSTTHENPIPQLLTVSENGIEIRDLDSKKYVSLVEQKGVNSIAYSIAEHKIYWSNDKYELMILDMNENNITKIATLQTIAHYLCIDWVTRNLYWMERDTSFRIIKFDLTMWENGIAKYDTFSKMKNFHSSTMLVLPSMGTLYGLVYFEKPKIMQWDLDGRDTGYYEKNFTCTSFDKSIFFIRDTKIDDMNTKEPLIYWLTHYLLFVTNINGSMCNSILQYREVETSDNFMFNSFTIDKTNIYISASDGNVDQYNNYNRNIYIYVFKKKDALLESKGVFKYIQKIILKEERFLWFDLYAFDESLQSYPPMRCLIPDKNVYKVQIMMVTTNSILLNLPEPVPKSGCKRYNLPSTLYTIYISYCLNNKLNKFYNFTVKTYERYYEIQNLTPLTEYKLQLALSNFYSDRLSMDPLFGSEVILRTNPSKVDAPENVTVQALTPTTAAVFWMLPEKLKCIPMTYEVYWILVNNRRQISEFLPVNEIKQRDSKFFTIIEPLIPGQKYMIYVRVYPANFSDFYSDSSSKILYMYSEPNNITLNDVNINSMNISWIPSVNLTIHYELEYKSVEMQRWQIANNSEVINGEKVMYYINNLLPGTLYEFHLILKYPKYEKDFIWPSDKRFTFSTLTGDTSKTPEILVTRYYLRFTLILVAIVIIICTGYFYYLYRQCNKRNEPPIMTNIELAILHEISNGNVQFNMLYSPTLEYNSDEYVLTKIEREQIILEKLLGSGAFGKVFQGKVKNFEKPGIEIPAAIKMLRKNATSQEKKKFLEEARLMNHFRHKHVLRLLAVCLDQESPLIVLELMETDLLQYLKDNRKFQPPDLHALRLQDLFAMCEDVARGCCYLENLRFVHRDLACRNCLVSSRDRENRVVKIGDFGLARDVYKDDYYCVKGQGRLPVCWMAPESLLIGIFTSKSDVWSFGVLMWEIISLGEHPYAGRTNLEVIDYVRNGGRLTMPLNCPPTLYEVMLRCWNPANDRPTFKLCLKDIIALRSNIEDTLLIVNPMDII